MQLPATGNGRQLAPALDLRRLTKRYDDGLLALEDFDTAGSPGGSDDFVRGSPESNALTTGPGTDDVDGLSGPDSISPPSRIPLG